MRRVVISALDLVQCRHSELVPLMIEGKLREAGFKVEEARTPLEFPSTLPERIQRPFAWMHELNGSLIVEQSE